MLLLVPLAPHHDTPHPIAIASHRVWVSVCARARMCSGLLCACGNASAPDTSIQPSNSFEWTACASIRSRFIFHFIYFVDEWRAGECSEKLSRWLAIRLTHIRFLTNCPRLRASVADDVTSPRRLSQIYVFRVLTTSDGRIDGDSATCTIAKPLAARRSSLICINRQMHRGYTYAGRWVTRPLRAFTIYSAK